MRVIRSLELKELNQQGTFSGIECVIQVHVVEQGTHNANVPSRGLIVQFLKRSGPVT